MKPLLTLALLSCSLSVFGATTESVVNQFLLRNWKIAKTNMPSVLALERQLDLKESEVAKKTQEKQQRFATVQANDLARGTKVGTAEINAKRSVEPMEYAIEQLKSEIIVINAKIDIERLAYFKKNRKAVEDFVEKNPELLGPAPKSKR